MRRSDEENLTNGILKKDFSPGNRFADDALTSQSISKPITFAGGT